VSQLRNLPAVVCARAFARTSQVLLQVLPSQGCSSVCRHSTEATLPNLSAKKKTNIQSLNLSAPFRVLLFSEDLKSRLLSMAMEKHSEQKEIMLKFTTLLSYATSFILVCPHSPWQFATSGKVFDSSRIRKKPFSFPLGFWQVIQGGRVLFGVLTYLAFSMGHCRPEDESRRTSTCLRSP